MKTKIVTKIAKWSYVAVIIISAPLWLILGAVDMDASNNGLNEGLEVIRKIGKK